MPMESASSMAVEHAGGLLFLRQVAKTRLPTLRLILVMLWLTGPGIARANSRQ
jgi:hypothetical protein